MDFDDDFDALRILSLLLQTVATNKEEQEPSELEKRVLQAKLKLQMPSLFELIQLMKKDEPIDSTMASDLRFALREAIENRLQELKKLLVSPEEQSMCSANDLNDLVEDRLQLLDSQLSELEDLDRHEAQLVDEIKPNLKEFINVFEFLLIDHGLKFQIDYDKKTIEGMILKAQSLLVQCRYRDTKKAFEKYGNKEKVAELRRKKEQLENRNKTFKRQLQKAYENKKKLEMIDVDLMQQLFKLSNELEQKKWALSISSK